MYCQEETCTETCNHPTDVFCSRHALKGELYLSQVSTSYCKEETCAENCEQDGDMFCPKHKHGCDEDGVPTADITLPPNPQLLVSFTTTVLTLLQSGLPTNDTKSIGMGQMGALEAEILRCKWNMEMIVWSRRLESKVRIFLENFSETQIRIQEKESFQINRVKFKRCKRCIVILYVPSVCWTNESRNDVEIEEWAKFRTSKAWCVAIYNEISDSWLHSIEHEFLGHPIVYTVGAFAIPHAVESDVTKICAPAVHYFNHWLPALYHGSIYMYTDSKIRLHFKDNGISKVCDNNSWFFICTTSDDVLVLKKYVSCLGWLHSSLQLQLLER